MGRCWGPRGPGTPRWLICSQPIAGEVGVDEKPEAQVGCGIANHPEESVPLAGVDVADEPEQALVAILRPSLHLGSKVPDGLYNVWAGEPAQPQALHQDLAGVACQLPLFLVILGVQGPIRAEGR